MRVLVFNGWASSPEAWSLCRFRRDRLFSYVEQLDGEPERALQGEDEVLLVGWSMGGSTALRLALAYPERVRGLVLVSAPARMMEDREHGWKGMSARRFDVFLKGVQMTHGAGFFGPPEGKPNPYAEDTDENLERGLDYLKRLDLRAEIAANPPQIPVALFHSERDGIIDRGNAEFLLRTLPDATLQVIAGAEHALPIMIPEMIDDAVRRMCL